MSDNSNKSFFQTLPGVMTATATLITAVVGLITVLNQIGVIGDKKKEKQTTEQVAQKLTDDSNSNSNSADVEEMVRKILKEEGNKKGSDSKNVEATVRDIVKEVKKEKGKSTPSKQNIEKMVRDAVDDYEEDVYHGEPEPDDYGGSYGGSTSSSVNVTGTWTDSNTGASYVFNQSGNSIAFQEQSINAYGALIISAEGSGTISNRNISVNYVTMFNTTGTANMTVSPDGSNITGTFRDNASGVTMTMNLWR